MNDKTDWWLWIAVLEASDSEVLLYSSISQVTTNYPLCVSEDKGDFDVSLGKVKYCSKVINNSKLQGFVEEIDANHNLNFELLDSSLNRAFPITDERKLVGETFGKSVVPIKSFYTTPDIELWENNLDALTSILLKLKDELNLPFDKDYAKKLGNFEIHDISGAIDSSISIELLNSSRSETSSAVVRVAKKEPLLNSRQQLHVICIEKKDVVFHKLISINKGEKLIEIGELPEDCHELECWLFDESGALIFRDHQYYIEKMNINMGISSQQITLEDKLTKSAGNSSEELGRKASLVTKTSTDRSVIQSDISDYKTFGEQMGQLQSDLFNAKGDDRWFGRSVECEVEVLKYIQSLLGGGRAKKAIIVDPFFGADAFERFVTRVEETGLDLVILTSLSDINPDTGEKFPVGSDPIDLLRNSIQKVKQIVNCNLRLVNINRGSSNQAFHDRYLVVYPFEELPTVYMLSNSINKMSGNWPFCMSKLEPAIARHVREYIELLCEGEDNSRKGNPNITYEWPENEQLSN
ncbi:MAG: VPA1262 family N-terminal domain-containing protein [Kangiellaceae bacterium]|nr:VPA1262 family N-terminal domain-containing protein [Kangiellaceae bacterium]MCW8998311.1 VPA1262 family N-terminal domain-containing protein [Kangiellaceae bacterium]MCW9015423.1 VPA1262 family N-terminal domain-containing protein [Kangiellaceae bacterium]